MVSEGQRDGDIQIHGWILGGKGAEEMGRLPWYIWRVLSRSEYNLWLTHRKLGATMLIAHRSFADAGKFLLQAIHLHISDEIADPWSSGSTNSKCAYM